MRVFECGIGQVCLDPDLVVGTVYCGGQGGDQGTRALVTNLYGGTYANAEHTQYTYASEANAKALAALCAQDGITFDPSIVASDEIQNFVNGTFQMAFCWNATQEATNADALTFDVFPMAFPAEDGVPSLQGGIWGFGIFNNGDDAKIAACKEFIKFVCDSDMTAEAVKASSFFPARTAAEGNDLTALFAGDEDMNVYNNCIMPNLGDYYTITPGFAEVRTLWWNFLQKLGAGEDVKATADDFNAQATATLPQ